MRWLPTATSAFLAAFPSRPSVALAFSRSSSPHRLLCQPSSILFLSSTALFSKRAAAGENDDSARAAATAAGECNATTDDDEVSSAPPLSEMFDSQYPGTAVRRLRAVRERVSTLSVDGTLDGPWEEVRRRILWAGGLRDLTDASPGAGYTGHSFNDFNHVDLTTMNDDTSDNLNDGSVKGIAVGNRLGPGIRVASIPELGPGGSWSTCAMGCNSEPPGDVAHVQFRSRVAFKLVWVPNRDYDTFVLLDDDGKLLAKGKPSDGPGALPRRREREMNYKIMKGSKYAVVAESLASLNSTKPSTEQ